MNFSVESLDCVTRTNADRPHESPGIVVGTILAICAEQVPHLVGIYSQPPGDRLDRAKEIRIDDDFAIAGDRHRAPRMRAECHLDGRCGRIGEAIA